MSHQDYEADARLLKIERDLERPLLHLRLSKQLEENWYIDTTPGHTNTIFVWHSFAIPANFLLLVVDLGAGVFSQGFVARVGFVIPAYLISLLFLKKGPECLRRAARVLPFLIMVAAITTIIPYADPVEAGRYQMALGLGYFLVATAIPYSFAENAIAVAGGHIMNIGLLLLLNVEIDAFLPTIVFQTLIVFASIFLGFGRARQSRNRYLISMRDSIKSQQLSDLTAALLDLSETDELTGLKNRRRLYSALPEIRARANNINGWLTAIMIDIDHFKSFNDTAGHIEGDQCLKRIADALAKCADVHRQFVARYGGEEFVALAVTKSPEEGERLAGEFRRSVENLALRHPAEKIGEKVTISVGYAQILGNDITSSTKLLSAADRALYAAKEAGRNRVCKGDVS